MNLFKSLILLMGGLAVASCGRQAEPVPNVAETRAPISFAEMDVPTSRRINLELQYDKFVVSAVKTMPDQTRQIVMPDYQVNYDDGWEYEGINGQYLKYWDLSAAKYTFVGVAPVPDNTETASYGYKNTTVEIANGAATISNIVGNISSGEYTSSLNAPDWMVAKTVRTQSALADLDSLQVDSTLHDANNPLLAYTDRVPLRFHHIMARVEFRVFSTPSPLILQSFSVDVADDQKIYNKGTYNTSTGWTSEINEDDHPLWYGHYNYPDGKVLSTDENNPSMLASHVEIPQAWAATGRKLKVTVETKDGTKYTGDIVLNTTTNKTNSWEQNKIYVYTIKIQTDGSHEVILFNVLMDTWKWKPGSSYDDTQTDW